MKTNQALPPLPFAAMPGHAKLWVYQTGKVLTPILGQIEAHLAPFISTWQSHGVPVHAQWAVYSQTFLLVAAIEEQTGVSGCSTDGMVRTLQTLSTATGQDFFNRLACGLWGPEGVFFSTAGTVRKGSLPYSITELQYFDVSLSSVAEIRKNWPQPLEISWMLAKSQAVA
jgi:hypothetical protein